MPAVRPYFDRVSRESHTPGRVLEELSDDFLIGRMEGCREGCAAATIMPKKDAQLVLVVLVLMSNRFMEGTMFSPSELLLLV